MEVRSEEQPRARSYRAMYYLPIAVLQITSRISGLKQNLLSHSSCRSEIHVQLGWILCFRVS